jgi:methyl-accepting chemotaxis protein
MSPHMQPSVVFNCMDAAAHHILSSAPSTADLMVEAHQEYRSMEAGFTAKKQTGQTLNTMTRIVHQLHRTTSQVSTRTTQQTAAACRVAQHLWAMT